jgi:hypothetical protein
MNQKRRREKCMEYLVHHEKILPPPRADEDLAAVIDEREDLAAG